MLYRTTYRLTLALWRSSIARRFLFQQARRLITAAIINRAVNHVKHKQTQVPSERVVIPVTLEE